MSFRARLLDGLTGLAFVSTIIIAGIVLRREFATRDAFSQPASQPIPVPNWDRYISTGRLIGRSDAPLKIVEFADFQCPACRSLNSAFKRLRDEYPGQFTISYHYAPLPYHPQAYPAARAAECAAEQQRFESYHDVLFANFDSLGRLSFTELARQAHVPDLTRFAACASRTDPIRRIDSDKALAFDTLGITGTPSVLVNGKLYPFAPTLTELKQMIEQAKANAVKKTAS